MGSGRLSGWCGKFWKGSSCLLRVVGGLFVLSCLSCFIAGDWACFGCLVSECCYFRVLGFIFCLLYSCLFDQLFSML